MAELTAAQIAKLTALPATAPSITGTPVVKQLAVWASAAAVQGDTGYITDSTGGGGNERLLKILATSQANLDLDGAGSGNYNGIRFYTSGVQKWYVGRDASAPSVDDFMIHGGTEIVRIVAASAAANTLYLKAGNTGFGNSTAGERVDVTGAIRATTYLTLTGSSGAAVSAASTGRIRYNESGNQFEASVNGAAYAALGFGSVSGATNGVAYFTSASAVTSGGLTWAPTSSSHGLLTAITISDPSFIIAAANGTTALSVKMSTGVNDVYMFTTQQGNQHITGTAAGDFGFRTFTDKTFWIGAGFTYSMASRIASTKIVSLDGTSSASYYEAADGSSATASGASKGRLIYNASAQKWQISENTGSYVNLVNASGANVGGAGATDQIAIWSAASVLTGTAGLTYTTGNLQSLVPAIGTGTSKAYLATNTTAAAAGAQQYSPLVSLIGQGWKTNSTAASQAVEFALQVRPVQGAAAPSGALHLLSQINAGGYASRWSLDTAGAVIQTMNGITSIGVRGGTLANATAAAAGVQQYSPMLSLIGQGWKTDATAASQPVEFGIQVAPVEGTASPQGRFQIFSQINGTGYVTVWEANEDGDVTNPGSLEVDGLLTAGDDVILAGAAKKVGFYGAVGQLRAANIADPTGGILLDTEARTAIGSILDLLEGTGLMATP